MGDFSSNAYAYPPVPPGLAHIFQFNSLDRVAPDNETDNADSFTNWFTIDIDPDLMYDMYLRGEYRQISEYIIRTIPLGGLRVNQQHNNNDNDSNNSKNNKTQNTSGNAHLNTSYLTSSSSPSPSTSSQSLSPPTPASVEAALQRGAMNTAVDELSLPPRLMTEAPQHESVPSQAVQGRSRWRRVRFEDEEEAKEVGPPLPAKRTPATSSQASMAAAASGSDSTRTVPVIETAEQIDDMPAIKQTEVSPTQTIEKVAETPHALNVEKIVRAPEAQTVAAATRSANLSSAPVRPTAPAEMVQVIRGGPPMPAVGDPATRSQAPMATVSSGGGASDGISDTIKKVVGTLQAQAAENIEVRTHVEATKSVNLSSTPARQTAPAGAMQATKVCPPLSAESASATRLQASIAAVGSGGAASSGFGGTIETVVETPPCWAPASWRPKPPPPPPGFPDKGVRQPPPPLVAAMAELLEKSQKSMGDGATAAEAHVWGSHHVKNAIPSPGPPAGEVDEGYRDVVEAVRVLESTASASEAGEVSRQSMDFESWLLRVDASGGLLAYLEVCRRTSTRLRSC